MSDLTVIYITANKLREHYAKHVREQLVNALDFDVPIISVSKVPMDFGINMVSPFPQASTWGVYRQTYLGLLLAKTKYVAIAEDDTLYHYSHFKLRPKDGHFAYNTICWSIYPWVNPPVFNFKERRVNHNNLICERELYLELLRYRFEKFPEDNIDGKDWGEPGKYDHHLIGRKYHTQLMTSTTPNVHIAHDDSLCIKAMGQRKRQGFIRAFEIPYWGSAKDLVNRYAQQT